MSKFTLSELQSIRGRQKFYQLVVDGERQFDTYWQQVEREGSLIAELKRLLAIMDQVAQMKQPLPKTKFRELQGRKKMDYVKEYEVKTSNLRLYLFQEKVTGMIVVYGGKKNTQNADIRHFRSLKKQYFAEK